MITNSQQTEFLLEQLNNLIKSVEDSNETNEQWFLNFLDSLNEISVRY